MENIEKEILRNISIDKILNQFEFGISNRATALTPSKLYRVMSFVNLNKNEFQLNVNLGFIIFLQRKMLQVI